MQREEPVKDSNKTLKPYEIYNRFERKEGQPVLTEAQYNNKFKSRIV